MIFDCRDMLVGQLLLQVKQRVGVAESNAFALYQVQRGTHYLLHEDAAVDEIRSTVVTRAEELLKLKLVNHTRAKFLFKKRLFLK